MASVALAPLSRLGHERLGAGPGRGAERVQAAEPLALGERALLVLGARIELLDLADLEREQVEVAVARAGACP